MKRLEFECICELAETMHNYIMSNSSENEYPVVSVYCDLINAKILIEALIEMGNPIGSIIELEDYEMSYYDKEYVIYLSEDGITCEKTYREGHYYNGDADITFVHEDCNSKLLNHIDSEVIYKFGFTGDSEEDFDADDECACNECECACKKDEEDSMSTSSATYKVNGKSVTKEDFDKKYAEFEDKYLDNVRDMLLSYCEFMDEINEWRSLFHW